jgi:hypothetical protein
MGRYLSQSKVKANVKVETFVRGVALDGEFLRAFTLPKIDIGKLLESLPL